MNDCNDYSLELYFENLNKYQNDIIIENIIDDIKNEKIIYIYEIFWWNCVSAYTASYGHSGGRGVFILTNMGNSILCIFKTGSTIEKTMTTRNIKIHPIVKSIIHHMSRNLRFLSYCVGESWKKPIILVENILQINENIIGNITDNKIMEIYDEYDKQLKQNLDTINELTEKCNKLKCKNEQIVKNVNEEMTKN